MLGFFLGILPGGGATHRLAGRVRGGEEAGQAAGAVRQGRVQGVAGPETANNAAATSSFIPLLTLGIPANATMALMFGALLIQGITPGPQLVEQDPELFWGVVNSMYIGNILLLIMSLPLVGLFVKILRVRAAILAPVTALITLLGAYTINNSMFDVTLVVVFGIVGYLMKKFGFEPGPLVLAFVLGIPAGELAAPLTAGLRRRPGGFFSRPISATLLAVFVLVAVLPGLRSLLAKRRAATADPATTRIKETV